MSVTVFIQSRNGAKRWQPGKRWLLLPALLIAAGIGAYEHNEQQFYQQQLNVDGEKAARKEQQQELLQLKSATASQLSMLATHVARMQAKLTRLEALGEQVAQSNQLEEQFDFSDEVGVGGLSDIGANIELEQLIADMDSLVLRIDKNNVQLSLLETVSSNLHIDKERYISGRPITKGWLSSHFGFRNDPFTGRRALHKGIDFAGKDGSEVVSTGGGVVTWAGPRFGYGELIEIDHGNGLRTRYGHNKALLVHAGDVVAKGEDIAVMGSTGRSTGPHVHYEVLRDGKQIDPKTFVYRKAG
ncbi:M23 family metallopeptidase [Shewanella surugensis]|uniref:Peptidoglycan DD-metalloendopeptidase family protein n=1 Tax=Shewanella surugensis TaxID=212020 RepID=A0ABT0L7D5_9GAMM|nr:M23 family metallopeptidase [Shewanella surugensis]MCL1123604.1 peptidoglycan DD-metalloendopeptidase family protein [Shewanella surugensis]